MLKLDDCIVCVFQIGVLNQVVYLPDGTQTAVPFKDLPFYLASFTRTYSVGTIYLDCPSAIYSVLEEQIKEAEIKSYNVHNIKIKRIGE